jgi:hypothetical protein
MKTLSTKIALLFVLTLSVLTSCKKDDAAPASASNYIKIQSPASVSPTGTESFTGTIEEFPGKDISSISYYYILNSEQYTERVSVESPFNRTTTSSYFNNQLAVTVDGQKTSSIYAVPFNQYTLTFKVPYASYNVKAGGYFMVGIEIHTTDGSKFLDSKKILVK